MSKIDAIPSNRCISVKTKEVIREMSEAELAIVTGSAMLAKELRDAAVRGAVGGATGTAYGWWCSPNGDQYYCYQEVFPE